MGQNGLFKILQFAYFLKRILFSLSSLFNIRPRFYLFYSRPEFSPYRGISAPLKQSIWLQANKTSGGRKKSMERRDFIKLAGLGGVVFASGLGFRAFGGSFDKRNDFYFVQLSD